MIDFEREIETRLDRFQALTNRGNVKDSNYTLYEIVRLMLGMITQKDRHRHPFNMHQHTPVRDVEPDAPIHEALRPTSEGTPPAPLLDPVKDAVNNATPVEPQQEPEQTAPLPTTTTTTSPAPGKDSRRPVHAPYGFTAAGNVRRKRT